MTSSTRTFMNIGFAQRALLGGLTLLLLVAGSGCGNRLKELEGTYYGDLSVIESNSPANHRVVTTITESSFKSGKRLEVQVMSRAENGQPSELVALVTLKKSGKNLVIDSTLVPSVPGRSEVKVRDRGACGQEEPGNTSSPSLTMVCATKDVISLFATNLSGSYRALLYMSKNGSAAPVNLPPEGRFTLEEIFKRVKSDSYENRLAAEKLYQANEEVKRVRAGLIPGLSLGGVANSVLSIATGGLGTGVGGAMGVAGMIGNLVPFIFPTQWFQLSAQKAFYEAEIQSYKSLIANQMNLSEDLYHQILRDQLMLGRVRGVRSRLEATRAMVEEQVNMGLSPNTDLVEYDDLLSQNEDAQSALRHLIRSQYAALSKGIGLSPRNGIRTLVPVVQPDPSSLEAIDSETFMAEAMATSMELRQFSFLRRAAEQKKEAAFWSFLSPSGWIGFNAGIFHDVHISKSKILEVQLLREQAERMIAEQIITVVSLHNRIIEQSKILNRQIEARTRSLETLEERYRVGGATILQLRTATEGLLQLETEKTNAEAAMAIVKGKLNRLLMKGPYHSVLTMQVGR